MTDKMEHSDDAVGADASLAQIATQWSLLRLAHAETFCGSESARQALVLRYSSAIRRYVGMLVRDSNLADEVSQEAMVRLMRGDFGVADAQRGRFRDLLRHALRNMVRNFFAKENRRKGAALDESMAPGVEDAADDPWLGAWVRSVLEIAWRNLESYQHATAGSVAYFVLKLRSDFPDEDSPALAERLSQASGRKFNAAAARQQLRRARLRFAQYLVEEVARGLSEPTPEALEQELINLGLMAPVRDFLPADWRERGELRSADDD